MMKRTWTPAVGLVLGLALVISPRTLHAQDFDLLIRNGRVLDGSGSPAFRADVGVRGDQIVALGLLEEATADRIIDAEGLFVAPGFIDMHSHADRALASDDGERRKAHNLVAQGITTVVVGPDGRNAVWPVAEEMAAYRRLGTDGMKETIRIGREAGIRVVGSHIKAKGPTTWGHAPTDVLLIERARREGVQVYLDQYPYETFGGGPTDVIPIWAYAPPGTDHSDGLDDPDLRVPGLLDNYRDNLRRNLDDPEIRPVLLEDITCLIDLKGGADRLVIVVSPADPDLIGKTLAEVAAAQGMTPEERLIDFALTGDASIRSGILFRPIAGHAFDVEHYMRQEYTATSTDAGVSMTTRPGLHPLAQYFPAVNQLVDPPEGAAPITFRHLASHTAGLIREPQLPGAATGPIATWEAKILASIPTTSFQRSSDDTASSVISKL